MVFLSVDGGATKTIAVCYGRSGEILGIGAGGPSNYRNIGVESAKANLYGSIKRAIERSSSSFDEIEKLTFAMAGVKDSSESTNIIEKFVAELGFKNPFVLLNDGEAGFNCRFFEQDGIISAPGTGMIAYGRKDNAMERSSGWGWLIGDEGGGFYIGKRAIQESARIADGRSGGSQVVLDEVMKFFSVQDPRQLVNEVYSTPINIRRIAMLARIVSKIATKGDKTALSLLLEAAEENARCITALQNRMSAYDLPVSGYGGVYRSGKTYWEKIKDTVLEKNPETVFIDPLYGYHAVLGSIYMVLKQISKNDIDQNGIEDDFNKKIDALPASEKSEYLLIP